MDEHKKLKRAHLAFMVRFFVKEICQPLPYRDGFLNGELHSVLSFAHEAELNNRAMSALYALLNKKAQESSNSPRAKNSGNGHSIKKGLRL